MTRLSEMAHKATLPASAGRVPLIIDGDSTNYVYDLAADLAGRTEVADLADNVTPTKGAALIKFNSALAYAGGTVGAFLVSILASTGSSLVGFINGTSGAVARTTQDKLRETASVTDFGSDNVAFTDLFAGTSFLTPAGSYGLAANATLADKGFTWHMDPGASFSGSGNILTPGMPGFDYTPNLKNILIAVKRGSVASPRTDGDAVSLAHKTSNVGDLAGAPNPAHAALHDHYGTATNSRSQAYYGEVVARAGGAAAFVEAARFHGIVPTGVTCKAYGGLFYAQNGGTGLNCIGNEAEVRRTVASDGALGRAWVSSGQFDGCYNATANTANATVGGVGGKPNFGFTINPFNTIAVQTGYLVPKSVVSGKTVNDAAFQCLEVGLNYGLDLAKGSYTIAIALPNNTPVTAFNAAGSSELEAWRVDASNVLQLGAGTSGVNSPSLKIGGTTVIDGSRNSTPASVAVGGGTAITKVVVYAPTITPASVAAATVAEQTFTVTGLTTADKVIVNPPAIGNATGIAGARVSAADTLAIRFVNPTAGALTPSSGIYTALAFRS